MRLPKPFYKLAVRFDVERLQQEVADLPASAWAKHPNDIKGNTSVRLISVDGGENDEVDGEMRATEHLQRCPYIQQVLSSFGVVWSRSRLLRLAPGAHVPEHSDINYHWFNRVRLHIPIFTRPEVRFYCGDASVHMAAGEAWVFDNWRAHRVENPTQIERVHLVADTSGSSAFWRFVTQSERMQATSLPYVAGKAASVLTERTRLSPVMAPAEVEYLIMDLRSELTTDDASAAGQERLVRYHGVLEAMCRDWRQLYALYGEDPNTRYEFVKLRDSVRTASRALSEGLVMRTNRVAAHAVLEGRVLRAVLPQSLRAPSRSARPNVQRPVFIVAAPRSGSTLLYETLAVSPQFFTLGGEAHWLVESIPHLRPGAGVSSNRLDATHATAEVAERIYAQIGERMQDHAGRPLERVDQQRFLEKTPKNALRIPFFRAIFPDAKFIFLWRDPRENIASMIAAWQSGRWQTYPQLEGFDPKWSLLLPPGWEQLRERPVHEITAWQWRVTNEIVLADLRSLPSEAWTAFCYADLIENPRTVVERACAFVGIDMDEALAQRVSQPLPHSRYTLTPPSAEKWRAYAADIEAVLPTVQSVWAALRDLRAQ